MKDYNDRPSKKRALRTVLALAVFVVIAAFLLFAEHPHIFSAPFPGLSSLRARSCISSCIADMATATYLVPFKAPCRAMDAPFPVLR